MCQHESLKKSTQHVLNYLAIGSHSLCGFYGKQRGWVVLPHTMSLHTFLNRPKSMGWHGDGIPKHSFSHSCRHACNVGSRHAGITSEIVESGFALEIVPSKRPPGKTIRRFWTAVFSSRATRLQTSTVLSDFCALNCSTSSPPIPMQVRTTPLSPSRRNSTCTTRSFPKVVKSQI